jgi:hypothetical protein
MQAGIVEKPATVEDAIREVSKIRTIVTDAVEDGVRSASQAIRHGRYAAEDAVEEVKHTSLTTSAVSRYLGLFFHDFEHTFHVSAHALVPFERVTILRR